MRIKQKEKDLLFIVDDYPFFSNLTKEVLSEMDNVEIMTFETGEECLNKLHLNPSVVLLDYDLSGYGIKRMNGIDVLREIKNKKKDTIVVMLSGHDDDDLKHISNIRGASDYLVKDFSKLVNIKKRVSNRVRQFNTIKENNSLMKLKFGIVGVVGIGLLLSLLDNFIF